MHKKDLIFSLPLSFVPHFYNNDGTRMQMSSSQMTQTLPLTKPEKPLVTTGLEHLFLNHSTANVISPCDGLILSIEKKYIIIKRKTPYFCGLDYDIVSLQDFDRYDIFCKHGQKVKCGQILGMAIDHNGNVINLLNGVNLKTAITISNGYNYEDSIQISERAAKKLSHTEIIKKVISIKESQIPLSLEHDFYKPFNEIGDKIEIGKPLVRIKNANLDNINELLSAPYEVLSEWNGEVVDIKFWINSWNVSIRELNLFLNKRCEMQQNKISEELERFRANHKKYTKEELQIKDIPDSIKQKIQDISGNLVRSGRWKYKHEVLDLVVEITIRTENRINIGDKLANRHGNKGVISIIMDDSEIVQTKNGPVDIVINPMGVPGRMNPGQILELYSSQIALNIKKDCYRVLQNPKLSEDQMIKYVKTYVGNFYKSIDKTDAKWISTGMTKILDSVDDMDILLKVVNDISFIAPHFEGISPFDLSKLAFEHEDYKKYEIEDKTLIYDPILDHSKMAATGWMYWGKLYHLSEEKINARSFGEYSKKNFQPLGGKKNRGGQRMGEMEVHAHMSLTGAGPSLVETMNTKSDDIQQKVAVLEQIVEMGFATLPETRDSGIAKIFRKLLNVVGLDLK